MSINLALLCLVAVPALWIAALYVIARRAIHERSLSALFLCLCIALPFGGVCFIFVSSPLETIEAFSNPLPFQQKLENLKNSFDREILTDRSIVRKALYEPLSAHSWSLYEAVNTMPRSYTEKLVAEMGSPTGVHKVEFYLCKVKCLSITEKKAFLLVLKSGTKELPYANTILSKPEFDLRVADEVLATHPTITLEGILVASVANPALDALLAEYVKSQVSLSEFTKFYATLLGYEENHGVKTRSAFLKKFLSVSPATIAEEFARAAALISFHQIDAEALSMAVQILRRLYPPDGQSVGGQQCATQEPHYCNPVVRSATAMLDDEVRKTLWNKVAGAQSQALSDCIQAHQSNPFVLLTPERSLWQKLNFAPPDWALYGYTGTEGIIS